MKLQHTWIKRYFLNASRSEGGKKEFITKDQESEQPQGSQHQKLEDNKWAITLRQSRYLSPAKPLTMDEYRK